MLYGMQTGATVMSVRSSQISVIHISSLITILSPVSIQTQSLALRALRKRKPQETQTANHGCQL